MKKLKVLCCIGLATLFMGSTFQRGYRIIVNDTPLPGIYEPSFALECSQEAIRAAEEITRHFETPTYTMIPVFCTEYTEADKSHLRGILLESFEGVEKLYTVSMGSETIGTVSNLRELYLIKNKYFPTWSPHASLSIREIYTYAGAETSSEDLHAVFQKLSTVTLPV